MTESNPAQTDSKKCYRCNGQGWTYFEERHENQPTEEPPKIECDLCGGSGVRGQSKCEMLSDFAEENRKLKAELQSAKSGLDTLVDRFLNWPLPASVCADPCATMKGYPNRIGTNLLTATEAKQMLEYVLQAATKMAAGGSDPARNWTEDATHENGNYQCRCSDCGRTFIGHKRRGQCKLCAHDRESKSYRDHEVTANRPTKIVAELAQLRAEKAFLKSVGLTVGPIKEAGKEPRLAYVIENGSELDNTDTVNKMVDALVALSAAKAELEKARKEIEIYADANVRLRNAVEKSAVGAATDPAVEKQKQTVESAVGLCDFTKHPNGSGWFRTPAGAWVCSFLRTIDGKPCDNCMAMLIPGDVDFALFGYIGNVRFDDADIVVAKHLSSPETSGEADGGKK